MEPEILKQLLDRYLEERPHDVALFSQLKEQSVGVQHFTDDLLDRFAFDSRLKLYASILAVYRQEAVPMLRHRMESEEQDISKEILRRMIQHFERNPHIWGGA